MAAAPVFPFLGEITANNVNIRAGQSENFEKLCVLNAGDQVIVLEKVYSWYKIKIPDTAKSFITDQYLRLVDQVTGEVTANNVNVRARPDLNGSILGQLKLGEKVTLLQKANGWYQIRPVEGTYGWVAEDLIAYRSQDISTFRPTEPDKETPQETQDATSETTARITFEGYIRPYPGMNTGGSFLLIEDGKPTFALKAPPEMLRGFLNYKVTIEGQIEESLHAGASYPFIHVAKVQIIF